MSELLNELQQSLELAWTERHQNPQQMISQSTVLLHQAKEKADSLAIGLAYRNLGFADFMQGNLDQAWERLTAALETGRRHHMPSLTADASNFLAGIYRTLGNTSSALTFLENALRIQTDIGNIESIVPIKMNIGILLHDLQRHEEAIHNYQEALEILINYPHSTRQLEVNGNMAMSLVALGKTEEAIGLFKQVIQQAEKENLLHHKTRNLVNLGEAYNKTKQYAESLNVLQQALTLLEKAKIPEGKAYCLYSLAAVQKNLADYNSALYSLTEADTIAQELQIMPLRPQIMFEQYQIYKQQQLYVAALEAHEKYHQFNQQLRENNAEQELRLFTLERDFEKTVAEAEINRLKNVELAELLEKLRGADQAKTKLLVELGHKTQQLETMVKQDVLTGIHNRRFLEQNLEQELQQAKQDHYPLSIALIDIDDFKRVNDFYSHQIGDQVLNIIGQLMRNCIRARDIAARYGGEEFVLALPRASLKQATAVCERLRQSIEQYPWHQIHPTLQITASIGISSDISVANHEKLLDLADTQMYRAKRSGKNKVCTMETPAIGSGITFET